MRRRLAFLALLVLVAAVQATSLNFQSASDLDRVTNLTYRLDHDLYSGVVYVRGGSSANYNNYVGYWEGRNTAGCIADTNGRDQGGVVLTSPTYMTYAAATFRGVSASCILPSSMAIPLWDINKNLMLAPTKFGSSFNISPNAGDRLEVKIVGGTTYVFNNGRPVYQGGSLAQNPSYIAFGAYTWPQQTAPGEYIYWDDIVYGETENKYVLGLPETDDDLIIILQDIINPSASGLAYGSNGTILNSNTMYGTWARGNSSISLDTQPNETIQFINYDTGKVISTYYTGTAYTGTVTIDIKTLLLDPEEPDGYYALYFPGHAAYSNRILKKSTGASVTWNEKEYSLGTTGASTYYILSGGYWDTSTYSYKMAVWSVTDGRFVQNTSLSASSGSVSQTWSSDMSQGVYYALLYATELSNGREHIIGNDYTTLTALFPLTFRYMDAETVQPIESVVANVSQGDGWSNGTSDANGYFITDPIFNSGMIIGSNATKTGYQLDWWNSTPMKTLEVNITIPLISSTPVCSGLCLNGLDRSSSGSYRNPIPGATCYLANSTYAENWTVTTNSVGLYNKSGLGGQYLYDVWCTALGYSNSPVYRKQVVGA